ncbi:MAG: hypothetical protein ACJA1P_002307 [Maribacter sp.]|jgi:hypothetical protein
MRCWKLKVYAIPEFLYSISKNKVVQDRFAPTFAVECQKNQSYRTMFYGLGEWSDFPIKLKENKENLIPRRSY